jgi:L-asparaginase II
VDAISVAVERGSLVESRHRVHAVCVRPDEVLETWGDPSLLTFLRSAAKPFQALPVAGLGVPSAELAIACASHAASPEQLEAVRALLARSGSAEDDLECGPEDGSKLRHNCSGKHAGMLLVCAERGWPRSGYRLPDHPLQEELLRIVSEAAEVSPQEIPTAPDGCGVVTFGLTLERMARMFSRLVLGELAAAGRIVEAMTAHPELVEGRGFPATEVMLAVPGAVAKGGAEGVLCVGLPDGSGYALKVEDGSTRATGPAAGALLGLAELAQMPLTNSRGEDVGKIRPSTFPQEL